MNLELISFELCPYGHRSRILVLHKNIACTITYINKIKPPEWFRTLAPSGKGPLLRVNDNTVIFESPVISEYLDTITGGGLIQADPLIYALNRSWIEYSSGLFRDLLALMQAKSHQHFDATIIGLRAKYTWLEKILGEGPYFNGPTLSLVDMAYAPFFVRTHYLGADTLLHPNELFPKIKNWSNALRNLPAVNASLGANFSGLLHTEVRETGRYAAKQFGL